MPFRDLEKKREYHRDYMRERRKGLTGNSTSELNPDTKTLKFDSARPHVHRCIKIAGIWRRVAEQEGRTYDRITGDLLRLE
jgi:hypothetical protein